MGDLNGKTAIVTGANSGMGMATVRALSDMGAKVIMLCRSEKRGKEAFDTLMAEKERDLEMILCDLGDYDSIRDFVEKVEERYARIDILVNNAGFIALNRQETKEGLEMQFGVNYVGHFLLTSLLIDRMQPGARIVNVSSGAHKIGKIHFEDINLERSFNVFKAYGQSKLATVLYTRELAKRLEAKGITVNCCHPGAVATNMGVDRNTGFGKTVTRMLKPFFLTPEEGARTAVFLASDPSVKDVTGEYFYKCRIARSSKRSKDMGLAARLYAFTKELVE
ncbi:MAG: SDR family oxidoreductase [Lachnospiraceae bacterium]|nr:SDR family oxidoreductase [Lachnospiraceae bacterium]